jgi:hypothetical protein
MMFGLTLYRPWRNLIWKRAVFTEANHGDACPVDLDDKMNSDITMND